MKDTSLTFGSEKPLARPSWAPWASYTAWDSLDWLEDIGDVLYDGRPPVRGESRLLEGNDGIFLSRTVSQWVFWTPRYCLYDIGRWHRTAIAQACFAQVTLEDIVTQPPPRQWPQLRVTVGDVVGLPTMLTLPVVTGGLQVFETAIWYEEEPDTFHETRDGPWRVAEYEIGQDGGGELVICHHGPDGDRLIAHAVRSPYHVCAAGNLDLGVNGFENIRQLFLGNRAAHL